LSAINSLKGSKAGIENKTRLTFAEIDKRVDMRRRKASDTMGVASTGIESQKTSPRVNPMSLRAGSTQNDSG